MKRMANPSKCARMFTTHLVQYQDESTEVEPALAESWESSADGLTWTFHLRVGVKFHDGTVFNADAVLFSLNRQHDPSHPFHKVGGTPIYWSVHRVGGYRREDCRLGRLYCPDCSQPSLCSFHCYVSHGPVLRLSAQARVKKWGEDFTNHPVGTGAFSFVRWDRGDKVVLEVNRDYWGGRPNLDRIIFRSIPDNSVRLIELQNGSIHAMEFPNPDDLPQIREDPNLTVVEGPGMNVGYLAMNTEKNTVG